MKKIVLFLVLLLTIVIGCAETRPIKVGFVAIMSGRKSQLGIDGRDSVQLAVAQINEAGGINGRKLDLVIKDNLGTPEGNTKAFEEFAAEGIQFVVGPMISLMAESTINTIEGKDMLVFSPSMSTSYLSGRDDNLLRSVPSTQGQGRDLAKFASRLGNKTVVTILDLGNKRYTESVAQAYDETFASAGGRVVETLTIDGDGTDYEAITKTVMDLNPDGVLLSMSAIDAAFTAQQLAKAGYSNTLYAPSWALSNDLYEQGGNAVEGLYLVTEAKREGKADLEAFNAAFKKMFNKDGSFLGSLAYDAAQILFTGMGNASEVTPEAVKQALLEQKDFRGIERDIHLDEYGDTIIDRLIMQIQNGSFQEAK